ncbi:hypothetical protein Trco_004134 [Trichoderma cornu-damae]|uniref:ATP-dependent DNA helicase II subunit 1 n=1 Tax=Trichoderma cornu-damae TaxID=654480 RepID=A0A9P8TTW2_9HYPO|nr:hypothetical protein Trco_004134 [Trichoderma cornu-damae]
MADRQRDWRREENDEDDEGEQEFDEASFKAQKDAVLLAVEVSPSMLEPPPASSSRKADRDSPVQAALKCAHHLMEQRIISNPKDMMGILLFGTEKTRFRDDKAGRGGLGYPNCYLFTDLDVPAAADVKALKALVGEEGDEDDDDVLKPAADAVSMSNVLFCANQIFTTKAANFGSRRLFIVTDNDDPHASDKAARAAAAVRAKDLYDLGITIDLFPIIRGESKFDLTKFYDDIVYRDANAEANGIEVRTSKSEDGLSLLHSLISNVNSKQTPKRALFHLPFEVAPGLRITVKGYNVVHRQAPARTCYVWLDGEKAQIATGEMTRVAEDTARTVDKQEIKKAYKFGGEYVYFTPEEQKSLRDFGKPVIRVIGFKHRSTIPVWASVKKSTFIFPSEEDYVGSSRVFSALWKKLLDDDKIGVAWCVLRSDAQPMLAALVPSRGQSDEASGAPYLPAGLWLYPLPVADDLRDISADGRIDCSEDLKTKMRVIVQQLNLPKGVYNPLKYPNPALQWHYKILQTLALDEEVPEKPEDATEPKNKAISKRAGGYLEDWAETLKDDADRAARCRSLKREVEDDVSERPAKQQRKAAAERPSGSAFSMAQLKAAVESEGLSKMTVAQLKDVAGAKGLSTSGRKADLVERIEQWDGNASSRFIPPWLPSEPLPSSTRNRLHSPSPSQEPDTAQSPYRPDRCAQPPLTPLGRPSSMADFLASFNFRDEEPSGPDGQPCASIEELQSRLRDVFAGRVTATRAERIATRLDLAASAQLVLGLSEGENEVLEGLSTLDPSLGGALSTSVSEGPDAGQTSRAVLVGDALMDQPPDDPVLQRSIANHVAAGIGEVDGSEWTVREASRGTHSWILAYACKDSMEHWQRQHKSQTKTPVADYSQRELDPLLASRPAFDCRGSIVFTFSRNSRSISIEYDHMPLHRTVAELAILFKPPSPRRPPPATEKQPKTPRQPGLSKKKRDADKTPGGESSKTRKRKRKTDDVALPGEPDSNDASQPRQLQDVDADADAAAAAVVGQLPPASQPGVAEDRQLQAGEESSGSAGQQQQSQAGQAAAQHAAAGLLINVSPEEAERRRNVAVVMLRDAGVDPDSLSSEQFNIFANQSPELQKESLSMLVKYGAERLRIVHPGNKEGSAQPSAPASPPTPATPSSMQGSPSGPVTANELVLQTPGSSSNAKKGRRKGQGPSGGAEGAGADPNAAKKPRRRGAPKSRVACFQCKQRKVKCPRETPICNECREAGLICEFPAPKQKPKKSNAFITTEDEQDDYEPGAEVHDESPLDHHQLQDDAEGYPEIDDGSVHAQMPIADALASNMSVVADWEPNHNPSSYFSSTNMGVSVSEAGASQPSHHSSIPLSDLILPPGRSYYATLPAAAEIQDQTLTQPMAHEQRSNPGKPSALVGSGRATATRAAQEEDHHSALSSTTASDWSGSGSAVTQAAAAVVAAVVTSMQDQSSREPAFGMPDSSGARSSTWCPDNPQQSPMGTPQQQSVAAASLGRSGAASPANGLSWAGSRAGKHSGRGAVHDSSAADAYRSPTLSDQQQSGAHTSGLQAPVGMATSAAYNSYDRYSSTRGADAPPTDRITYEPYSYQRDATSTTPYTSYGHGSHTTTTAAPIPATAMSSADRSGSHTYGSYSNSATRNPPHASSASYNSSRTNTQTHDFSNGSSDSSRNSGHGFHMRSQSSTPRLGQSVMKQDRSYSAFPSQIQQQQQQTNTHQHPHHTNQHPAWYSFSNQSNTSFSPSSGHGSSYSWNMPGDS